MQYSASFPVVWKILFQDTLHCGDYWRKSGESFFSGTFTDAQRFPQSSSLFYGTGPEEAKGGEGAFYTIIPLLQNRKLLL